MEGRNANLSRVEVLSTEIKALQVLTISVMEVRMYFYIKWSIFGGTLFLCFIQRTAESQDAVCAKLNLFIELVSKANEHDGSLQKTPGRKVKVHAVRLAKSTHF